MTMTALEQHTQQDDKTELIDSVVYNLEEERDDITHDDVMEEVDYIVSSRLNTRQELLDFIQSVPQTEEDVVDEGLIDTTSLDRYLETLAFVLMEREVMTRVEV